MLFLHNFCKIRKEAIIQQEVEGTITYDREFLPPRQSGYDASTNESGGKKDRQKFVEYFENQYPPLKLCFIFYRYTQIGRTCSKSAK